MIQDYSTLKAAIADWLARADLTSRIPTFIQLAEARINRELRVKSMQVQASGTATAGVIAYPTDARAIQSLTVELGGRRHEIHPLPPESLKDVSTAGGLPCGYVVVEDEIRLIGGTGSEDYTLTYWKAVPALSDSASQNWLILREPGLYLYGALIEAAPYLRGRQDDLVVWSQQFRAIADGMAREDDLARYGNAPAQVIHAP